MARFFAPSSVALIGATDRDGSVGRTVDNNLLNGSFKGILGSSVDAQFGPVLLFGSGGQLVEVYRDRALALRLLPQLSRSV